MQSQNTTTLTFEVQQLNRSSKFGLHEMTAALVAAAFAISIINGTSAMIAIEGTSRAMVFSVITAFVLVFFWQRTRITALKIAVMALPAAAGLLMLRFTGNGAALIGNSVMETAGAEIRSIYMPFSVTCSEAEAYKCIAVTLGLLAIWVTLLCVHLIMDNNRIAVAFVVAILAVLNLVFGNVASWAWVLCNLMCAVTVFAKAFLDEDHTGNVHSRFAGSVCFIVCMAVIITGVMLLTVKPASYERPDVFKSMSEGIISRIEEARYGSSEARALPAGDFRNLGNLKFTDAVMLEVTADQHDSLYLRGFVGSQYSTDGWTVEEGHALYKYADTFYWLHKAGLFGQNQIAVAAQLLDKEAAENTISITVDNVAADSRYYYTPYEITSLTSDGSELLNTSLLDDGSIPAKGWRGQRRYTMTSLENQVKRYPVIVADLKKNKEQSQDYLIKESHYNAFVYETYTELPDKTRELIDNHLKNYAGTIPEGESHLNYTKAKEIVLDYLNREIKYSEEIQERNEDVDFVTDFLEVSRSGYSVHYATAAVLMLRYYGIPARYVEGYLITPDAVKNAAADSTISITDKNAHAWVEYYQDGIGWVPFEVTPPYMDVMEQPEKLTSAGAGGTSGQSTGAAMEMAQDNYEPEEPEKEDDEKSVPWDKIMVGAGIVMLLALLLAVIIRLILRKRKLNALNASFEMDNRNASVINLFVYILTLHGLLGTDREENIYELYQKAAFSAEQVSAGERSQVFEYKNRLIEQVKKECKITKRFIYKWIKAIY